MNTLRALTVITAIFAAGAVDSDHLVAAWILGTTAIIGLIITSLVEAPDQ